MHTFVNLAINENMIETGNCTLQEIVLETYGKKRDLDEGAKCLNCSKEKRVHHSEVTKLTYDTPSDIIFVVKKFSYKHNKTKKLLIKIACDETIKIPFWEKTSLNAGSQGELDLNGQLEMTYNLRGVVCHDGNYYDSGHYRTLLVEHDSAKIGRETVYHEMNDDSHFILEKKRFFEDIKENAYIYHSSTRTSGNMNENLYNTHISDRTTLKTLEESCKVACRKEQTVRRTKKIRKKSDQHQFTLKTKKGQKPIHSKNLLVQEVFRMEMNENNGSCLGTDQHMCINWDTSCTDFCRKIFPTEKESRDLCHVSMSSFMDQKGLFASKKLQQNTYICRYIGKKVAKDSTGVYVANVDTKLTIDAAEIEILAKYANHSCLPNCDLQKVSRELRQTGPISPYGTDEFRNELWIKVKADVTIQKGQQITFDYGENLHFEGECLCPRCTGEI